LIFTRRVYYQYKNNLIPSKYINSYLEKDKIETEEIVSKEEEFNKRFDIKNIEDEENEDISLYEIKIREYINIFKNHLEYEDINLLLKNYKEKDKLDGIIN
jgi:hypothetical protein